jgi:ABC-2 type transport system permease protein
MRDAIRPVRVLRYSAANAWADMWVIFSPLTWSVGWVSRVLVQVVFFALIGLLLDSDEAVRYLFIGNAVMITAMEATMSVTTTTWERRQGTMPLLVAAPTRLWPVFVGRSIQWLPTGVITASVALFALGPAFGVSWTPTRALAVLACLVVVAVATYCFALLLSAIVLTAMDLHNVISNIAQATTMLIAGVMVPVAFWPGWVQAVAQALPLTHGLAAIRAITDAPAVAPVAGEIATGLLLTLGVGAAWLLGAALLLEHLAAAGRRDGSIEFAE